MLSAHFIRRHCLCMWAALSISMLVLIFDYWFYVNISLIAIFFLFFFFTYLAYFNERFVLYVGCLAVCTSLILLFFAASALYYVATQINFGPPEQNYFAFFIPFIVVLPIIWIICTGSHSKSDFVCNGKFARFVPDEGDFAGSKADILLSIIAIPILSYIESLGLTFFSFVIYIFFQGFAIFMLFKLKGAIRELPGLRRKEIKGSFYYTFMQIEEIRQARSRWWLPRLVKWLDSLRRSRTN
jgi:hypothetical protein